MDDQTLLELAAMTLQTRGIKVRPFWLPSCTSRSPPWRQGMLR